MNEAFRRAARQNPGSGVARDVFNASHQIRDEHAQEARRRDEQSAVNQGREIGYEWFTSKTSRYQRGVTEESVRARWKNADARLARFDSNVRIRFLLNFAEGLQLSETRPHYVYSDTIELLDGIYEKTSSLLRFMRKPHGRLSSVSQMFLAVYKDVEVLTEEQYTELTKSVSEGIPDGMKQELPQTIEGISKWRETSRSQPPKQ